MSKAILSTQNLSFAYISGQKILKNISLEVSKPSFVGITGSNGSGKSTFLQVLNGLIPHHTEGKMEGKVWINGLDTVATTTYKLAKTVGILFQNPDFAIFNLTVQEEAEFGARNLKIPNPEKAAGEALRLLGLEKMADKNPHELSMGQKQRLSLVGLLAMNCSIIALDEPSSMLDYKTSIDLYEHLKKLHKNQAKTIFTIEHDTDYLWRYCDTVWVFHEGEVVLKGNPKQVFTQTKKLQNYGIKIPNTSSATKV